MVAIPMQKELFTELYAVESANLPALFAWKPEIGASVTKSIGWKLAYQMRKHIGGCWIWAEERLVTDTRFGDEAIQSTLQTLWQTQNKEFGRVRGVSQDSLWKPQPLSLAEFVASGLVSDLDRQIKAQLNKYNKRIQNGLVVRGYYVRGWELDSNPVISISISSAIQSTHDLARIARSMPDPNRLLGLLVKDITGNYKGEIEEVLGRLGNHRVRLLGQATREEMQKRIKDAPDNDLVLKVKTSTNDGYDYISSVLEIVVRTKDYSRLKIDGQEALSALQIKPDQRAAIVTEVAALVRRAGYIRAEPIAAAHYPSNFVSASRIGFAPAAKLRDGITCQADARSVLRMLRQHPPYRRVPELEGNAPIRIGVFNLIGDHPQGRNYLNSIRTELRAIHFDVEFIGVERPTADSQYQMEQAISRLQKEQPHIIIGFLPGSPNEEEEGPDSLYNQLKGYMVKQDIQSQFIYEHTLGNDYALSNIILGIIGKTGNIPYILEKPLPYADVVAGIDVARLANERRSGSCSLPAVTRIYTAEGDFLRYILSEGPIEGETLPKQVLRQLFPGEYFAQNRIVVHRDGPFRGNEKQDLQDWAKEIAATFSLIEVIKSGVPRLYSRTLQIQSPAKGDALILNSREAFLVSSLPPHKNSTPRPLLVRTDGTLTIQQALHSILSMTVVHYGSLLQPRLPVTIHYSDQIGYLALQGIKPRDTNGVRPYWL